MVPLYAWESFLGLAYQDQRIYWETARDLYESFVIFSFYKLIIEYLGGPVALRRRLRAHDTDFSHIVPFCCLNEWAPATVFINNTKFAVLQYVFVKCFTACVAFICVMNGVYGEGSISPKTGYLWLTIISNFSQLVSMYALVLLYLATSHWLHPIRPVPKFLSIKAVVFLTYWQSILITLLVSAGVIHATDLVSVDNVAAGIQDFVICIEMFLAAIAHRYAFPISDFEDPQAEPVRFIPLFRSFMHAINVTDFVSEIRERGFNPVDSHPPFQSLREELLYADELSAVATAETVYTIPMTETSDC